MVTRAAFNFLNALWFTVSVCSVVFVLLVALVFSAYAVQLAIAAHKRGLARARSVGNSKQPPPPL